MHKYWCVLLLLIAHASLAQNPANAAGAMPKPPALAQSSPLYRKAIDTYFAAEADYRKQDYAAAQKKLQELWVEFPPGDPAWKKLQRESALLQSLADYGTPAGYAALRMLTDCVEWRMKQGSPAAVPATVQLTVVLVGKSVGPEPETPADIDAHKGPLVTRKLDAALDGAEGERIINESYWLFDEYLLAMTQGRLQVKRVFVHLPEFTVPVELHRDRVVLSRETSESIWASVPADIARTTDWWHLVYPSHIPQSPAFSGEPFITGGMRSGPAQGRSPCFLSEDLKFLRTANQNGRRVLLDNERRVALPQWLQHEFFHHLFATYPQLQLEATPHQWHDRKAWPGDFVGNVEADYYAEALHKRLERQENPPLAVALRHAAPIH